MYYILHSLFPEAKEEHGRRNCRVFFIGSFLYAMVFVFLKTMSLRGIDMMWEAALWGLLIVFVVDVMTVGILYKQFFGRSILCEVNDQDDDRWSYDGETHKYRRRDPEKDRLHRERAEKRKAVLQHKELVRAARVVQNWWRRVLYQPGKGKWYKEAEERFAMTLR